MVEPGLYAGPESLRVAGERRALWSCLLAAPLTLGLISLIFSSVSLSEFVLLVVGGMVYVSIARGRLLGSSIRIDGRQLPELDALARGVAARLGCAKPQIFVRDDPFVPIAAVGTGEPYALIVSSQYYDHLRPGELAFLIARELGHIGAGHTRLASLLSASGRENPVVALVFGAWLRRTEYTADRVGLLCCDRLEDALGAIAITTFHAIGRRVDLSVLAEQRAELAAEPALRLGEWIGAVPYATHRLEALRSFDDSALARWWRARLAPATFRPEADAPVTFADVTRRECAPAARRLGAAVIDLAVISAILKTPVAVVVTKASKQSDVEVPAALATLIHHLPYVQIGANVIATLLIFFAYSALLVGLSGQTLGMMIMELRVVTLHYARPSPLQSVWRYGVALGSACTALAMVGVFLRVQPHDRLSRTRVVRGRKAAA